jgi:nitrite reductase (NADH) large subunit
MTAEVIRPEQQCMHQFFDIIVVGMGPVGLHFIHKLAGMNTTVSIAVFGDEPWEPYNRVKLSSLISGQIKEDSLYEASHITDLPSVTPFYNNRIVSIDRDAHQIIDSQGNRFSYGKLVLATGSRAHVPVIDGVNLKNVFRFRDLHDAMSLMGRSVMTRTTVVIGGGLLGLEAAKSMQRFNTDVHVIEHDMWLMFKQLDKVAGAYLQEHIEKTGIKVHTSQHVQKITGEHRVDGVQLANKEIIKCDTVILATGIIPNVQLAVESGLHIGRGIRVNDNLQTNDSDIYAIGECAEHEEKVYGLVGPGYEQAAVLAHHIDGRKSHYKGSISAAKLKVVGLPVISAGDAVQREGLVDEYVYQDHQKNIYRKLFVKNGRLCGVVGVGEWPGMQRFQEAVARRRRIWPWQTGRFIAEGVMWNDVLSENVIDWPASATVCNCTGVTRGQLDMAHSKGAISVAQIASMTGASTVCGSCTNLIGDFLGSSVAAEPVKGFKTLLVASLLATIAALIFFLSPPLEYAQTVQAAWSVDVLWRDGLLKQLSGYSVLGIAVVISVISMRKRIKKFVNLWEFSSWRILHVVLGLLILGLLMLHTGFRLGNNINFALMLTFTALLFVGAIAGIAIAYEHSLPKRMAKHLRSLALWSHIILLWPLPALLGFHVVKTYYF